ncbi:MAG: tetratricopeptide repeat protein [Rhodothermales bacterium]
MKQRAWYVLAWGLMLSLGWSAPGCRQPAPQDAPPNTGAEEAALQPVSLPALDGLQESARLQLQDQYARLQDLAGRRDADGAELGAAYGLMGQLLLAYEYDAAAEPALLHAEHLLPDSVQWPYYLGYLYQRRADIEATARWFERALALAPEDVPTRVHLAEVYRDLGRDAEARAALHEATRLDPRCAPAYFLLGQMAAEPSEAITHYEKVLQLQPAASVVHNPLGLAYRNQGNLEKSRFHLARRGNTSAKLADVRLQELELLKEGTNSKLFLARTFMMQRMFREAATLFAQVVEEEPDNASAYLNLGAALGQLGRVREAVAALEQAARLDPSESKTHYNLGILYGAHAELDKARARFQTAIELDPDYSEAHLALAKLFWRERNCREALPHFARFLAASPEHIEARIDQAICHVQVGRYAEARALLEAGLEAFPQHPGLYDAMIRVLAAGADDDVRDGARALEMASRLVSVMRRAETLESLAMAYAETARYDEAVRHQREAIQAARLQNLNTWLDHLNANLRRYEQKLPCRTPWEAVIFDK